MPVKKTKKPIYKAKIKALGRMYHGEGKTVEEAIANLNVGNAARGMSILTISKGEKSVERVLSSMATARLFAPAGALVKEIVMKQTLRVFDI